MDIKELLLSLEGRINRAKFWLGLLIVIACSFVATFIFYTIFNLSFVTAIHTTTGKIWLFINFTLMAYPTLALTVKRLNDRDRPRWMLLTYWGPALLDLFANITGFKWSLQMIYGTLMYGFTTFGWIVTIITLPLIVWFIIEFGILKGTQGPNRHGPDPLTKTEDLAA